MSSPAGVFAVDDPAASPAARSTAFAFIPDYDHTIDKLQGIADTTRDRHKASAVTTRRSRSR